MSSNPELDHAYEWDKSRGASSIYNHAIGVAKLALFANGVPAEKIESRADDELISPEGWAAINGLVIAAYGRNRESGISVGSVPGTVIVNRTSRRSSQFEHAA